MKSTLTSIGAWRLGVTVVVLLGLAIGLVYYFHGANNVHTGAGHNDYGEGGQAKIPVKTIHPRYDKSFDITETRPATVLAYYRDHLESRVAGVIRKVWVDVGTVVEKDQALVDIYVPEREAREREEVAKVARAEAEVKQKEAAVRVAKSASLAAQSKWHARQAMWESAKAYQTFRAKQAQRYSRLWDKRAIEFQLVDEEQERYVAAQQAVIAANEAAEAGEAEYRASVDKIELAKADLKDAQALVNVTKAELAHAHELVGFAKIVAPFAGVIVLRQNHANEGKVVQSADQGHPTPLLILERQDIVIIQMRVPDVYAAYITPGTEVVFETPSLPGVKIKGKVTRYSQSLITAEKDRTMLVEVDLWNKTPKEFNKVKDDDSFKAGLRPGMPGASNLPVVPKIEGRPPEGMRLGLLPGYFGNMTLKLNKFANVYLLPSQAIFNRDGLPYIYLVQDGRAKLQRVRVPVNDGKLAKVDLLDQEGSTIGELTGKEEIIVTGMSGLSDGQLVKPALRKSWGPSKSDKK